ncbi:glycosyltransferase [Halopiger xanaduensis]|uniref:Glycosyl transferase group 1 n=1 Tax=Halopiger xanaduensis (strain DSM 18323 / JCM 14033 / SH-6) TaxID=797210 RepID=F8DA42_HALXS|nr:glycosyltransferase [Halopiger xanaduensis]AEH36964.1 glycosyl transferase group 1 [Halopiger xanaduensis SH-6]
MTATRPSTAVLWLTPDKPEDISVGRRRIADHLEESGVDVTLRGTTPKTVLQSLRDAGQYDVVAGTTRAGAIAGTAIKLATGTPLIVDHIDPIRQFETNNPRWLAEIVRRLENVAFRVADRVLYVYDEETPRVGRFGTVTKTALGVDFDRFAYPDPEVVERAESALEGTVAENVAIYVGGLEPIYHIRDLLAAATQLDESWTLLVLGTGSLSEQIERAAAAHENIVYPGTVPHEDIPGYLRAADVGVCLVDDPHTLKVLEYGAAGLPTVQVRGRAEERFDGLVEFCDPTPDSIARAIERAEEETDSMRGKQSMTTELQSFAREFDWAEIAETYKNTITNLK